MLFNPFSIKNIEIRLDAIACASYEDIKNTAEINDKNLLFLNETLIGDRLKEKYRCIKSVKIIRHFSNSVTLEVNGRKGMAYLKSQSLAESSATPSLNLILENIASSGAEATYSLSLSKEEEFFLVDDEGVIFNKTLINAPLPIIYILDKNIPEQVINMFLKKLVNAFSKITSYGLTLNNVIVFPQQVAIIDTDIKIVSIINDQLDKQLAALQLIINKAKIEGISIQLIDLRFDKPVVKYAPKEKKR